MNKQQLIALLKLGLIQSNPQLTTRLRIKGKYGSELVKSLLIQNLILPFIFILLYGGIFIFQNLYQYAGQFNGLFLVLVGVSLVQGISLIYNTFFDSNDFDHYKTLPISIHLVILSKAFVTVFSIIVYIIPCFIAFLNYSLNAGTNIFLSVILSLFLWLFLIIFIFTLSLLVIFGLSLLPIFKQRLKQIAKAMMIITSVFVLGAIFYNSYMGTNIETKPFFFIRPMLNILAQPFTTSGILSFIGIITILFVLLLLTKLKIYPLLIQNDIQTVAKSTKRNIGKKDNGTKILWRYQLRLIGESTLLFQIFSSTLLLPMILSFSLINLGQMIQSMNHFYGLFFLMGVLIASLVVTPNSLPAILVSIERQNFIFMTTTPLKLKSYLNLKLRFILTIQLSVNFILFVAICLLGKLPWLVSLLFIFGGVLYTIPACISQLIKDYRNPFFVWSDYTQLISKGQSNAKMAVLLLLKWIVMIIVAAVVVLAVHFLQPFWPNLMVSIVTLSFLLAYNISQYLKWRHI